MESLLVSCERTNDDNALSIWVFADIHYLLLISWDVFYFNACMTLWTTARWRGRVCSFGTGGQTDCRRVSLFSDVHYLLLLSWHVFFNSDVVMTVAIENYYDLQFNRSVLEADTTSVGFCFLTCCLMNVHLRSLLCSCLFLQCQTVRNI